MLALAVAKNGSTPGHCQECAYRSTSSTIFVFPRGTHLLIPWDPGLSWGKGGVAVPLVCIHVVGGERDDLHATLLELRLKFPHLTCKRGVGVDKLTRIVRLCTS